LELEGRDGKEMLVLVEYLTEKFDVDTKVTSNSNM